LLTEKNIIAREGQGRKYGEKNSASGKVGRRCKKAAARRTVLGEMSVFQSGKP